MSKKPWMPLYIADYLKDTTHLGAIESGAYLHLIMDYWQNGKLPDDDRHLARIAKLTDKEWKGLKPVLQAFFHDGWKHKRIDIELAHAEEVSSKRRDAAHARHQAKAEQADSKPDANADAIADANAHTLHTSQRREDFTADAVSSKYAFEDGVIRLNQRDFDAWSKAFSNLDLAAELLSLSKWAESEGKNWFHALKGALAKRNREVKAAKARPAPDPNQPRWLDGIEGVI